MNLFTIINASIHFDGAVLTRIHFDGAVLTRITIIFHCLRFLLGSTDGVHAYTAKIFDLDNA
jgi:hypothetical protein